jgi:DNA-binding MarR family transcriptional regulator
MTEHLGNPRELSATVDEALTFLETVQERTWEFFIERRLSRGPEDPTRVQLVVLQSVARSGPRSVSELADLLQVSTPTASQLVNLLVVRGWCQIALSPRDRRRHDVQLTPKGHAVLGERMQKRLSRVRALLEALTPEERAQFIHLVNRIVTLWQSNEGSSEHGD